MGFFEFGGARSDDLGLIVSQRPNYPAPERLGEVVTIPGRNGTLHVSTGSYGNVTLPYECWFKGGPARAHAIKEWLLGGEGYSKLSDSYDPEHFRKAQFTGPQDIENILGQFGELTIQFDCRPEAFEVQGQYPTTFSQSGNLYNPTPFPAKPLIRAYGAGTVKVNGFVCVINNVDGYVDIDCELQQAFKETTDCNNNVSVPDFPILGAGKNTIVLTGISRIDITPRWWTL